MPKGQETPVPSQDRDGTSIICRRLWSGFLFTFRDGNKEKGSKLLIPGRDGTSHLVPFTMLTQNRKRKKDVVQKLLFLRVEGVPAFDLLPTKKIVCREKSQNFDDFCYNTRLPHALSPDRISVWVLRSWILQRCLVSAPTIKKLRLLEKICVTKKI